MKVSIIGAGNVGGLTAMRLAQEGIGEIILLDIAKGLSNGKAMDMEDARSLLKLNYNIQGTEDITSIRDSSIVVITAGFTRKPGMNREELLSKNAQILKEISQEIRKSAAKAVVIVVTNPLDLMTYFVLKLTGFKRNRVLGMGVSLDAARFANLIASELKIPVTDIDPCVIGSHGEGMLPLPRFTTIKGVKLDEFLDEKKIAVLTQETVSRGAQIVSLLGSGSAYFAPSAAIASLVRAIAKDEKRTIGVSSYLDGEYGIKDVCLGVPCRIGKLGIESIVELELNKEEKEALHNCAGSLRRLIAQLSF